MVSKKIQLIDDIEFILEECARLQRLIQKGFEQIPEEDHWFSIPHPTALYGEMLCGRAAAQRLEKLVQEAGRRAGLAKRVEAKTLRKPLAELIVQRFIRESRPVNIQQVDRVLAAAGKAAAKSCADIRHLVPCHLMLAKDPAELRIGPVVFRNRAPTRRLLFDKYRDYLRGSSKEGKELGRPLMADALRYYRAFDWVAEVEIKGCDARRSANLAERAVISALNCLHLILGARWTDRMRVGGPAIRVDRRADLTISALGDLTVSASVRWPGQVNLQDGWSVHLDEPQLKRSLELCAIALEAAVDPDLERPLSHRFLDAAQWFGEAARDDSVSTRIVKYVTSLERMVMTDEKDDITLIVSERVATLCFDWQSQANWEAWRNKAQKTYSLRSKLVHGSVSPNDPELQKNVRMSAELSEATLRGAIIVFGEAGLRMEKISSKRLGRLFEELVIRSKEAVKSRAGGAH